MKKGNKFHDHEPRSSSSCAACKLLKRRCGPNCTFAPYFRADEPKKFAKVHKVFGASNVSKLLNEVPEEHREDMVNSLTYEAEARLSDPVYGCLGPISFLYRRMVQLQHDLALARARLAQCTMEARPEAPPIEEGGGSDCRCCCCYCYSNSSDVGNSQGGVVASDHHNHIHELPNMWYGLQSDGTNCTPLVSLSPNGGNNGGDFGQVPLLPL